MTGKVEYLPQSEAAKRLGVNGESLRSRRRRGTVDCKKSDDGIWLYAVPAMGGSKSTTISDDEWQAIRELLPVASTRQEPESKPEHQGTYSVVSLWDVHVPEADAFAFKAVIDFIADYQPDHIVLGGDFLELESCSMHGGTANPKALVDEIKAGKKALQRLKDAAPNAAITYLEGNHETRLNRIVSSSIPSFDGALTVPALLGLQEQMVEWVPYRNLWSPTINGITVSLCYTHGEWAVNHHAAKHLQMYGVSVRYGHTHKPQTYSRGFADGRVHMAIGSPCLRTLAPHWADPHNGWLHGFGLDEFMPNGTFTAHNIVMSNRKFAWGGKVYG